VLPDEERLPAAEPAPAKEAGWSDALATDPADEILSELEGDSAEDGDDEDDEFGGEGSGEDWN
jgi:hypothetical protein